MLLRHLAIQHQVSRFPRAQIVGDILARVGMDLHPAFRTRPGEKVIDEEGVRLRHVKPDVQRTNKEQDLSLAVREAYNGRLPGLKPGLNLRSSGDLHLFRGTTQETQNLLPDKQGSFACRFHFVLPGIPGFDCAAPTKKGKQACGSLSFAAEAASCRGVKEHKTATPSYKRFHFLKPFRADFRFRKDQAGAVVPCFLRVVVTQHMIRNLGPVTEQVIERLIRIRGNIDLRNFRGCHFRQHVAPYTLPFQSGRNGRRLMVRM